MTFLLQLWGLFLEAAPYLMVGFAVAGLLHQFLPPGFVQKHLGGRSWGNIFKASLIGTPVPLCSCGVVPVGLGLHRDGASKATSVSFLIATPENGVESISLTYSFFGLPFTLMRIVFSVLVANLTAMAVALFGEDDGPEESLELGSCCGSETKPEAESCGTSTCESQVEHSGSHCGSGSSSCDSERESDSCCSSEPEKRDGLRFVLDDFAPAIASWVVLGFLISAAITTFLPEDLLAKVDPFWAVPLAGLVGIPMYVCASASTPIAFSLFMSGLSPGACLVFLLTGPATNSANFPLYLKAFGAKTTAIYYGGIYFVSVALGLLLDALLTAPEALQLTGAAHHHFEPGFFHYSGAVLLALLLAHGILVQLRRPADDCCGH